MFAEEIYRVVVEVIDVQGLIWPAPTIAERAASARGTIKKAGKLPNPFVDVLVGGISQVTSVREATATCSFNRMFIFSDVEADGSIDVRVCHKTLLSHDLIGSYLTSVREIRNLPNHRMAQTLCPLIVRDAPSEPRGFVRLSITVLKIGEAVELGDEETGTGAGAGRILYTPELDFDTYNLSINVYLGLELFKCISSQGAQPPSCRIRIEFGGTSLETATHKAARSPTWNEILRFPANVPCSTDRIAVELWDEREHVSTAYLSFQSILKSELKPTWLNFYTETQPRSQARQATGGAFAAFAALFELDDEEEESDGLTEFYYLGRVLISASCTKHKSPPPAQSYPCRPVEPPATQECILWGDLFDISGLHNVSDIALEVAFGDWLTSLKAQGRANEGFTFPQDEGRLPEYASHLPLQIDSCYNLILRVYGRLVAEGGERGPRRFIAYALIPAADLMKKSGNPEWFPIQRTTKTIQTATGANPAYVLAGFTLEKAADIKARSIERLQRASLNLEPYQLQGSFFQAVDLPVHRTTMPSPYVMVTLGGNSVTTRTIFYTTHPDWNEMLTFECTLPSDVTLARDLQIQVISSKSVLGELTLPMGYLTTTDAQKPQWYPLASQRFPKTKAKLLCCFRLTLPGSAVETKEFPDPQYGPNYAPYDLRLFVVGCRLFSSVTPNRPSDSIPPKLQLEFGRSPVEPNTRLWHDTCQAAIKGANGNFNFLTPFEVKCFLPTNQMIQSYLDIRVFSQLESGPSEIGTAYLHLTPLQTIFSRPVQEALTREFGTTDVIMDEIFPLLTSTVRRPEFLSSLDQFGRAPETTALQLVEEEEEEEEAPILEEGEVIEEGGAEIRKKWHPRISEIKDANHYTSPVDTFFSREPEVLQSLLKSSKYFDEVAKFDWGVTAVEEEEKQEELRKPFDTELHPSDLPYFTLPIVGPSRNHTTAGLPEILGVVKIRCKVMDPDEDKRAEINEVETLDLALRYSPKLKVRIHIISASGLIPPVGRSAEVESTEWFTIVRNSKMLTSGTHEIRDTRFTGKGFAPDFYRSFELDCDFPGDSLLSLGIASAATVWDSEQLLGHTLIDLENRWFHPGYKGFLDTLMPIEMRTLRTPWHGDPVGTIRCWIDLQTEDNATMRPMIPVSLPPPEMVQVRIVIWQLKNIPVESSGTMSLYVVGLMSGVDEEVIQQETDTHWNSSDGRAVFNWRFLFDVTVPGAASQLRLQVWNRNLLAAHEAVAETVLELSSDLERCKNAKEAITLDRTWLKLYHPSNPGNVMGLLELELYLIPGTESVDNPVGLGRDEPNRDPYLPEVTENRNYIATSALGVGLFAASNKVAIGAKICSWMIALVVIVTVIYMFRKLFME